MSVEQSRHYRWRLMALSLAMLLPSLGTSVANVALPALAASFGASIQAVQWVVIGYLLAVTALIVAAGRLGDLLGRRQMLLAGIALFALASAICAMAPNLFLLVAARSVQGIGAAAMMALTVASVSDMVPKDRIGAAMGLLGTVSAVGTALGPSLGGALIAAWGWPAVFAAMAIAGAVSFVVSHRLLPSEPPIEQRRASLDVAGMIVLALSLGTYALATTLDTAWRGSAGAMLAIFAAVGVGVFVAVERRAASPLVEMRLLRDSALSASLASMAFVSAIVMTTLVVGPFYLSGVLGLDSVRTGLVMSVGPGVAALVGVPAGRLVDRVDAHTMTIAGLIGIAAGSLLMTILPGLFGVVGYIGSLALITAGYALFQAANNTALMAAAAADRRGVTSALLGLSRNLGLITGASTMGAIFARASRGLPMLGLPSGGETGMQVTFAVATAIAGLVLGLACSVGWRHRGPASPGRPGQYHRGHTGSG